ncbi:hypothetical protein DFH08DRAFT_701729, partial [Mycena albidolilacea]
FIRLLHQTQSFRNTDELHIPSAPHCRCNKRMLAIAVVRMTAIQYISLPVCGCSPAEPRLLQGGLFPCSPRHPSLAVDVQVLDFVMSLFVNMTPNNTAFTATLEGFLSKRGYKLAMKDTMRVRFGNALEWYTSLHLTTRNTIDKLIDTAREISLDYSNSCAATRSIPIPEDRLPPSSPPAPSRSPIRLSTRATVSDEEEEDETTSSYPPATPTPQSRKRPRGSSDVHNKEPPKNPFPEPPLRTRPSDYLVRRCPACFGGLKHDPSQAVDIHICGDACFTQKRKRCSGSRDPRMHPRSVFLSEETANQMGAHVENIRPPKPRPVKQARQEEEDGYEAGLKMPRSALIECEASFKAADENREKASTKFFEDTGLMGLLCRHDRVLFLVNMQSAGEKQFYMLALLEMMFPHLPSDIRVGLLYDVACMLHLSCAKYGFLDRYMDRILFAVSVFHAFGHWWACQIVYHPLKCIGFGLTNGEGCERFWHSISNLIAYLRVSGYHRRLFTLDFQIEQDDRASRVGRLAAWLNRRTINCEEKLRQALADLEACGVSETVLRAQWKDQVDVQTRPLKRQAKTHGTAAVDRILQARKTAEVAFIRVKSMEETMADASSETHERVYADLHLPEARTALKQAKEKAKHLEQELGIQDAAVLKKLAHGDYFNARMNARVVKDRLVSKLRARRFELDSIERSFRRTRSENQRNDHASQAIKRREPNISKLLKTYNTLCEDIASLIRTKKAPKGAVAPPPIPEKGLYQLDVDDAIWQDAGLEDVDGDPPRWLTDDNVRSGIRAMLLKDRCEEEAPRLLRERGHLQIWFATEWNVVCELMADSEGASTF